MTLFQLHIIFLTRSWCRQHLFCLLFAYAVAFGELFIFKHGLGIKISSQIHTLLRTLCPSASSHMVSGLLWTDPATLFFFPLLVVATAPLITNRTAATLLISPTKASEALPCLYCNYRSPKLNVKDPAGPRMCQAHSPTSLTRLWCHALFLCQWLAPSPMATETTIWVNDLYLQFDLYPFRCYSFVCVLCNSFPFRTRQRSG